MKTLEDTVKEVRARLGKGDCLIVCRDHRHAKCTRNCPGPNVEGSICYVLEGNDTRSDAEVIAEIEATEIEGKTAN